MSLKNYRPITPSTRQLKTVDYKQFLTKDVAPEKSLLDVCKRRGGRNNTGRITTRHQGGGHKRKYRLVDFKRDKDGIDAVIATVEYDPNRSAFISLVNYKDGEKRYILSYEGAKVGDVIQSGKNAQFRPGHSMSLKDMPIGSIVHNIELQSGRGGKMVRSAGQSARLIAKQDDGFVVVRLPSSEMRLFHQDCKATFGVISNKAHNTQVIGKAGRTRWRGIRPTVRGTAMNPVDHPHGGGEGRHNGYRLETPWAVPTKGYKTRKRNKHSNMYIISRRKK
ncbi:MAG: 50S ribosomal protein L2 [Chlamydiia bacterium]